MKSRTAGRQRRTGRQATAFLQLMAVVAACAGGTDRGRHAGGDTTSGAALGPTPAGGAAAAVAPTVVAELAASRCDATQLSARRLGADAGAGQRGVTYLLRNTGPGPCRLGGTPSLQLVDSAGSPMALPNAVPAAAMVDDATTLADPLLLSPGDSAVFQITYTGIAAGTLTCRVATAVRITPPGGSRTLTIADTLRVCGQTLHVRPILHAVPAVPR